MEKKTQGSVNCINGVMLGSLISQMFQIEKQFQLFVFSLVVFT